MLATILIDNIACGELKGEWGLSIYIEYNGKNILLDTGASDLFAKNAQKLEKSIVQCHCMAYTSWQAQKLACKGLYGIGIKVIATPAHIVELVT